MTALLEALAAIEGQIARLDEQLAGGSLAGGRAERLEVIPARCKSEFCQMTFEEALAQTMSIVGLLDVGGCRILDADGFQALLGNAQRQRPIVIIAPRGSACPRPCVLLRL